MIRYYTEDEYAKELEHRRISRKMDRLEKLSWKVAIGFMVWGVIYFGLIWAAIIYLFR